MKTTSKLILVLFSIAALVSCKKGGEVEPQTTTPVAVITHAVGDSYEGGIVFSVDASGLHGMIAATADQGYHINWSTANASCAAYSAGTGGWRLPTKAELETMKTKKATIGGFLNKDYWSSTKSTDMNSAWTLYFGATTGGITITPWKLLTNCTICVRAVKAF